VKKKISVMARGLASYGLKPLSKNEKESIKIALRFMLQHKGAVSILLIAGILAAGFEGGTLGLLGLAVSVLSAGSGVVAVELPDFIKSIIFSSLGEVSPGGVFLFLVGVAVVAQILKSVLVYISTIAQINLSFGLEGEAQDKAINYAMTLSYEEVTRYPSGTLVSLADQAGVISNVVSELSKAARAIFMILTYGVVMLVISPLLTLISVLIFGVLLASINRVIKRLRLLARRSFLSSVDTTRWAVEFLGAPRLLRIFASAGRAEEKIREARYRRIGADRKSTTIIAMIMPTFEAVTVFGAGLFLTFGYLFAGEAAIEIVPKLFVFVLVFFRLKPQVLMLNNLRISFSKLLPQFEIIGDFLSPARRNFERKVGAPFLGIKQCIEFQNVSFKYAGAPAYALTNVQFRIQRGETVALVGASGSGKTTVTSILLGLYQPTEGKVLVDGVNISTLNLGQWRRSIGVVDQDVFLLNATISKNIDFGRFESDFESIREAAINAGADDFIRQLESGYETAIGDRGFKLSGGQQQRIALARALVRKPRFLILDEATSALDSVSEQLIQDTVERLHEKVTILIIAHRLSTVEIADKIIVLEKGEIVEIGTKDELLKSGQYFAKAWGIQRGD
jgi:ABC-type multidrug transport system fused ATPase/permease subunit